MSRSNAVYKETYNRCLDFIGEIGLDGSLPPETAFAERWGISRTTVRAVLEHLKDTGLIDWEGRRKTILRLPVATDFYSADETQTTAEKVEAAFMEYVLGGDLAPGTILRESELAREFGASPSAVREFLIRFSRFGLIEKEPNRHWILRGFTQEFAVELFDVREMFETRAFARFCNEGPESESHQALIAMKPDFQRLGDAIETEFMSFPRLDERFHRIVIDLLDNRFVDDFFQIVSMIFHYHYRWNKSDEQERNLTATREHLAVIGAVESGDMTAASAAFHTHLCSARRTLMQSVRWDGKT